MSIANSNWEVFRKNKKYKNNHNNKDIEKKKIIQNIYTSDKEGKDKEKEKEKIYKNFIEPCKKHKCISIDKNEGTLINIPNMNTIDSKNLSSSSSCINDIFLPVIIGTDKIVIKTKKNIKEEYICHICIITLHGEVQYDRLISSNIYVNIVNYRKEITGIKEDDLKDITYTEKDCIDDLYNIIKDRIIIGWNINNDLNILKMIHPNFQKRDLSQNKNFILNDSSNISRYNAIDRYKEQLPWKYRTNITNNLCEDCYALLWMYKNVYKVWENEFRNKYGNSIREHTKRVKRRLLFSPKQESYKRNNTTSSTNDSDSDNNSDSNSDSTV